MPWRANRQNSMLLHSDELVGKIRQLASTMDFDIVQIESVMGLYLGTLPETKRYKSIEMFQNVTSQQFGRISHVQQGGDRKLRAWINGVSHGVLGTPLRGEV